MADFDYSNDIAPLKGDYFRDIYSSKNLSQDERRGLELMELKGLQRMAEDRREHETYMLNTQRQQLEFDKTRLAIDAVKKQTKDQLEAEAMYPKIMEQIGGIMNDQSLDTPTKVQNLQKLKLSYGRPVFSNPDIKSAFDSTIDGITTKDQYDTARLNVGAQLAASGQTKAAEAALSGLDPRIAKPLVESAAFVEAQQKEKLKLENLSEQQELQREQQDKYRTLNLEALKESESALRALMPKSLSGKSEDDILNLIAQRGTAGKGAAGKGAAGKDGAQVPQQPLFNPLQQLELQEIMLDLNPTLKPEQLKGVPPEELFGHALRMVKRKRRSFIQPQSQTTTTKDLFNQ